VPTASSASAPAPATPARRQITFPIEVVIGTDRFARDRARAILEQFGFDFSDKPSWSELHVNVTLPEGWQEFRNTHGHYIVDEKGRHRVSISEKSAIYERYASASIYPRIRIIDDENYESTHMGSRVLVTDGDTVLFTSAPIMIADRHSSEFYKARQEAVEAAHAWCNEHRPDWHDPAAYWD
jgi:hypothetical protein